MDNHILRYKYLPLNDNSLKVLREGKIKFTKPSEFNDPFDCKPEHDPLEYSKFLSQSKGLLRKVGDAMGLSPARRLENKYRMLKKIEHSIKDDRFSNGLTDNVGILSLSRDPLNLLMWSHYANSHTGFVVEFSIPQIVSITSDETEHLIQDYLFPLEVEYSAEMPIINPFDDRELNAKKQFLIKGIDWAYEKEERVIDFLRGPGNHPFNQKAILKSVIAGMRMSSHEYDRLESEVIKVNKRIDANISIHRAKACRGKFSIFVPDRPELSTHSEA